jgi:hypothetical protein
MTERSSWTGTAADLMRGSLDRRGDGISTGNAGGPKILARWQATSVGLRPSFERLASTFASVVKAGLEPG